MRKAWAYGAGAALLAIALVWAAVAAWQVHRAPTVQLAEGALRGREERGLRVFRAIPYAAPPVGDLRWKPPQPVQPWRGVRSASRFRATCPQPPTGFVGVPRRHMNEDCLTLDVYTPASAEAATAPRLPVIVWVHGGGFQFGSTAQPDFRPERLARHGTVLVTIQYRLGVFGFLAHPALTAESPQRSSGNYGLLDQIAALKWVQANIAQFGGDPDNVTIAGESAGGTSVGYLLASPLARGLFAKAIAESASRLFTPDPALNRAQGPDPVGPTPMEEAGAALDPDLDHLRSLGSWEVLERAAQFTEAYYAPGGQGKLGVRPEGRANDPAAHDSPWWAFVDGWLAPEPLERAAAEKRFTPAPLLAGTNADEGSVFSRTGIGDEAGYREYLARWYPEQADALFRLYSPGGDAAAAGAASKAGVEKAISGIIRDAFFVYGTKRLARAEQAAGAPAYLYRFEAAPPSTRTGPNGSWHGAEIPYVFGFVEDEPGATPEDRKLSEAMMTAWVNFARSGAPGSIEGVRWPPAWAAAGGAQRVMVLGTKPAVKMQDEGEHSRLRVFEQLYGGSGGGAR